MPPPPRAAFLRPALAGAAATCSGNGLARFAFVPLFPALVAAGWVDGAEAGLLGAAALLGYLIGILAGQPVARRLGVPRTLDLGMALVVLSVGACAWNGGFWWFAPWRVLAGVAGGFLMALAGPAAQASVPAERRGTAAGVAIGGVGFGIALGAVAVPALLPAGLPATWLGLAALVALLWAAAHPRWPDMPLRRGARLAAAGPIRGERLLLLAYAFHAAGMVPPMVYLADLAARGRGLGVGFGAAAWLLFGLGAAAGGVASGRVVDRIGGLPALRLWLLVQAVAVGMALPPVAWLMAPTALAAGLAAMGVTTVALSVSRELVPGGDPQRAAALWVRCTAVFAVVQTAAGFALAGLFAATGESHAAVFAAGLAASLAAFGAAVALARRPGLPTAR